MDSEEIVDDFNWILNEIEAKLYDGSLDVDYTDDLMKKMTEAKMAEKYISEMGTAICDIKNGNNEVAVTGNTENCSESLGKAAFDGLKSIWGKALQSIPTRGQITTTGTATFRIKLDSKFSWKLETGAKQTPKIERPKNGED